MKQILFFGDSLTAGYRVKENEAVPHLIQQKIDAEGLAYQVINAGISGDTTTSGLKRLEDQLKGTIAVFVLELGVNDLIRRVDPAKIEANLEAIIQRVKLLPDIRIALMGMNFSPIFERVAQQHQLAFVPFYLEGVAGKRTLNLPDRVHPNAAGYQVIADHIWPTIRSLLSA